MQIRTIAPSRRRHAGRQRMGQNRHLSNIFAKLGISSRSQLDRVLPGERAAV